MAKSLFKLRFCCRRRRGILKERISNDDGDINENANNAIGLDWQKNNFARESRFYVHFYAVVVRLPRESV